MKILTYNCLFFCIVLFTSCVQKQGPTEQEIQDRIDAAVKSALNEKQTEVRNSLNGEVSDEDAQNDGAPNSNNARKTSFVGVYQFDAPIYKNGDFSQKSVTHTWTLSINEDETCKLNSNSATYYGSWYKSVNGMTYNITFSDVLFIDTKGLHPEVDIECQWFYIDSSAFRAKDPTKRFKLTRIK